MSGSTPKITVLLDEGAPIAVSDPFLSSGHRVIYHSDVLDSGAPDEVVVAMAVLNDAILIAIDRDMKRIARRFGSSGAGDKYKSLHLIVVGCNEALAAKRLEHSMSFIENEWKVASQKRSRRLWLNIDPHRLTSYR